MSILFSRSVRSLDNDRGYVGIIVVIITTLIVTAWLIWFFLGQVTIYESSTVFTVRRDGMLMTTYGTEALTRIRPGQSGVYIPSTASNELGGHIPVLVMDTPASTSRQDGIVQVYLKAPASQDGTRNYAAPDSADSAGGEVKIAVDHLSPFALLIRARR